MKLVKLYSGTLEQEVSKKDDLSQLEKKVMLVYTGKFNSLDGEVEIKDEDIDKLYSNHNGILAGLKRLATGDIPVKHFPPLQLDHSTSAKDTVGRLIGDLEIGEHELSNGIKAKALMGTVRVLGKENVEKVVDGRWTHVSIGADLENHKITELTITPFPAAADASLLSRFGKLLYKYEDMDVIKKYLDYEIGIAKNEDGEMYWNVYKNKEQYSGGRCASESEGISKGKTYIEGQKKYGLSTDASLLSRARMGAIDIGKGKSGKKYYYENGNIYDEDGNHVGKAPNVKEAEEFISNNYKELSKGVSEMSYKEMAEKMAMYEKCKKHLMDEKKLSEEEADKELEGLDDEDVKKMAAEHDEKLSKLQKEKDEEEKKKTEMSGHRNKLISLVKEAKGAEEKVRLAGRKVKLASRLSSLKSMAKISPAEIRKLDLTELAKKSDEAIETALSMYEKREPMVNVGLYGSTKALSGSQLSGVLKKLQMEHKELETRLNMPSKRDAAMKRLTEVQEEMKKLEEVNVHIDAPGGDHPVNEKEYELEWSEVKKLMDEGKHEEAKERMKSYMKKLTEVKKPAEMSGEDVQKEMSALADDVKKMHTGIEEFAKLMAPQIGLDLKELV